VEGLKACFADDERRVILHLDSLIEQAVRLHTAMTVLDSFGRQDDGDKGGR
jgi:hypothetical protein